MQGPQGMRQKIQRCIVNENICVCAFHRHRFLSYDKQDRTVIIICYCPVRVCAYSVVFCFQVSYEALQYETIVFLVSTIERHYTVSVYAIQFAIQ